MLLTGNYRRTLDNKLRLAIPKQLREAIGYPQSTSLFIAPGMDQSLVIYTLEALEKLACEMEKLNPAAKDARAFTRLLYAQAQPADIDRQGRLRIPSELATLAAITSEVVVLGAMDHLEIWNAAAWEKFLDSSRAIYDELAESVMGRCRGVPADQSSFPKEAS
jgi:MraZ protein